jgi:hypothetical protein
MGNNSSRGGRFSERGSAGRAPSMRPSKGLTYASQRSTGFDDIPTDNPYKRVQSRDEILRKMIVSQSQIAKCRR